MVLELNASDDRGINVVREQIMSFASTRTLATHGFKLIILDEADAMTRDAQNALRRIIEKFTENVRFCLIGNYISKIIPALQSRCTKFRFAPLNQDQMQPRLQFVVKAERLTVTDDGEKALLALAQGDMRRVLNVLQSVSMAYEEVTEDAVYACVGQPSRKDISMIVEWMLNREFAEAYQLISEMKLRKGYALQDIITDVHSYVHRLDLPGHIKIYVLDKLADIEYRLSFGTNEKLQLGSLLAAFYVVRELAVKDAA